MKISKIGKLGFQLKNQNDSRKLKNFCILICHFTFYILIFTLFTAYVSAQDDLASPGEVVRESVRDRVKDRIEELAQKPKAYVGTLSQITDSTLEIKTNSGKTLLVSTSEDTTVMRVTGSRRSEIKFKDLVLDNFVIAMGFVDNKDVLTSKRIVTLSETPFRQKVSVFATVEENADGTLTVRSVKNQEAWRVQTNKKTVVWEKTQEGSENTKLDKIEPGDKIVAAGEVDQKKENTILAGQISIISKASQSLTR